MSGNWLDESEILFRIFFILSDDLKVRVNLGIPCLIFLSVLPLPQIFNILNGWLKSSYPKAPTSFLFSFFLWESSKACGTEQAILPFLNREEKKKRNRQQQLFPGGFVLELGVGSRRGGERSRRLLMLRAVRAEVDMQNCGAAAQGSDSYTSAPFPCLITWRAKHPGWECVKPQYLEQQFAALTSCEASPVCPQTSGLVPDSGLSLPGLGSFHSGGIVWKRVWSGIWGSCRFFQPGQPCDR